MLAISLMKKWQNLGKINILYCVDVFNVFIAFQAEERSVAV